MRNEVAVIGKAVGAKKVTPPRRAKPDIGSPPIPPTSGLDKAKYNSGLAGCQIYAYTKCGSLQIKSQDL